MVDLLNLRCFEALAADLHFGHAAERLGVSQSTLSRRIRRLERDLGTVLFQRTSRAVALTDSGRQLAVEIPPALRHLDRAIESVRHGPNDAWEL
jgi:DNA-binding transcriptional LysR family regulator